MREVDRKLKEAIMEAMRIEDEQLNKEVEKEGPHTFSKEYREKMDAIMQMYKKKSRRRVRIKYIMAATIVIFVFTIGLIQLNAPGLKANEVIINITEWGKSLITMKNDDKSDIVEEMVFSEERLGYIPDGFELVMEEYAFSYAHLRYEKEDSYFDIIASNATQERTLDSENIEEFAVRKTEDGLEYAIFSNAQGISKVIWRNQDTYILEGNLSPETLVEIMSNITE